MRGGARGLQAQAQELGIRELECQHLSVNSVDSLRRLLDLQEQLTNPSWGREDSDDSGDTVGEDRERGRGRGSGRGGGEGREREREGE